MTPDQKITRLNVLVHPHFRVKSTWSESLTISSPGFANQRRYLHRAALKHFCPTSPGEITVVMPHLRKDSLATWREGLKRVKNARLENPSLPQWTDLYRELKKRSRFPENVLLIRDIVNDSEATKHLPLRLAQHHKVIDAKTTVYVGGEWLRACVFNTADKLLLIPEISQVTIRGDAVLSCGYWSNNRKRQVELELKAIPAMFDGKYNGVATQAVYNSNEVVIFR